MINVPSRKLGLQEALLPSNPPPLNSQHKAALNTLISTPVPALDGGGGLVGLATAPPPSASVFNAQEALG